MLIRRLEWLDAAAPLNATGRNSPTCLLEFSDKPQFPMQSSGCHDGNNNDGSGLGLYVIYRSV